jgi:E3 ubiquitin-protein ligase TRIP12
MIKAKAKADRAAARANASAALQSALPSRNDTPASSRAHTPTGGRSTPAEEDGTPAPAQDAALISEAAESSSGAAPSKGVSIDRGELLKSKSGVMNRFIGLIVPILVDVYAASVSIPIRIKSLVSLLKAICFQEQDQLKQTLKVCFLSRYFGSLAYGC